jgi:hypothetical protein
MAELKHRHKEPETWYKVTPVYHEGMVETVDFELSISGQTLSVRSCPDMIADILEAAAGHIRARYAETVDA